MSTSIMTAPAIGSTWKFDLSRHEGEPDPAEPEAPGGADEDAEAEELLAAAVADEDTPDEPDNGKPDGADALGAAGKKALDRMKAERAAAKKEAADAKKQAADLARKVQEFEDRDKSELDRANAKAERLAEQASKATARAVSAEVRAQAVGQFADASDAVDALMRDPSKYLDSDGDINTDLIEADLADLLDRKPHWGKAAPAPAAAAPAVQKKQPRPDLSQGSRGTPAAVDYRTASDEEFTAALAEFGVRRRR